MRLKTFGSALAAVAMLAGMVVPPATASAIPAPASITRIDTPKSNPPVCEPGSPSWIWVSWVTCIKVDTYGLEIKTVSARFGYGPRGTPGRVPDSFKGYWTITFSRGGHTHNLVTGHRLRLVMDKKAMGKHTHIQHREEGSKLHQRMCRLL